MKIPCVWIVQNVHVFSNKSENWLRCCILSDEVAEWLRRWTANPLCSARVGSNPILVEKLCYYWNSCTRRDEHLYIFIERILTVILRLWLFTLLLTFPFLYTHLYNKNDYKLYTISKNRRMAPWLSWLKRLSVNRRSSVRIQVVPFQMVHYNLR